MKAVKWLAIALGIYVGIVVVVESLIGYFQPRGENTLVITTTNAGLDQVSAAVLPATRTKDVMSS
jgi:hypothetical protein